MKTSTKFWLTIGIIFLISFNIFWYEYEKYYSWTRFGDDSPHTFLVGVYAVMFDVIAVGYSLRYFIPKFNKWLDNKFPLSK